MSYYFKIRNWGEGWGFMPSDRALVFVVQSVVELGLKIIPISCQHSKRHLNHCTRGTSLFFVPPTQHTKLLCHSFIPGTAFLSLKSLTFSTSKSHCHRSRLSFRMRNSPSKLCGSFLLEMFGHGRRSAQCLRCYLVQPGSQSIQFSNSSPNPISDFSLLVMCN